MTNLESQTTENLTHHDDDDIDDDDDQLNSQHKIVPLASEINKQDSLKKTTNQSNFDAANLIKTDIKKYVSTTIPEDHSGFIHCHIKREKEGRTKAFSTIYYLYFDGQTTDDQSLLLIARKHFAVGGHSEYFIGYNVDNPSKNLNEENSIAKLKRTTNIGHEYVLYDHQKTGKPQLAAMLYEKHLIGKGHPRRLDVLLHDTEKTTRQLKDNETIIDEWAAGHSNDLMQLRNKIPVFNEETKSHHLTFVESRVIQPSHKNFQLVMLTTNNAEHIVMEFGRIDANNFALDYRYPLRATEAFAIALSCFHNRFTT
ncbi:unnamed protein product [Adineta steineri]|uniref:Tubby C-terminal domain-containing protein n=1 Tax=Adineta steineri TaxID=433720 RepID=A0A814IEJ8_9BILA|nr:unnamed protein product [Adineta steineri]CAF3875442.1 unnamed protein product [Adineta steineri]